MTGILMDWRAKEPEADPRRRVGQPVQELTLTSILASDLSKLFRPGPGRSAYVIFEPEVGAGRPDVLVVSASSTALARYIKAGLRVSTPSATRALSAADESSLGISVPYARSLRKGLLQDGWSQQEYARASVIVHDSLAIEAKVKDWKQALRQVAKFHVTAHRSAIFMPLKTARLIPIPVLEQYGAGLLVETGGRAEWLLTSPRRELEGPSTIWMLEVLVRAMENGLAYKLSDSRNFTSESSKALTRGL
ncbi:MAG: hypothetical protein ACOH14_02380 [Rhodoglobus sp.]